MPSRLDPPELASSLLPTPSLGLVQITQRPSLAAVNAGVVQRLTWLTAARLVLYAVLLSAIAAFYLQGDRASFPVSLRLVLATLAGAFAAAGIYAGWLRTRKGLVALAWTQVVIDQLLWTALVYISGGPLSGATTFYGLSCILAAVTLGSDGAVAAALIGGGLYAMLVVGFVTRIIGPPADQAPFTGRSLQLIYPALVALLALMVVAVLAGYLARRLQTESGRVIEVTERAERAERLAALGRVAAALAHEIRNPLGSISGSIDMIRESPGLGEQEKRLCEIVRSETDRLNDLVSDMMNLARPRTPLFEQVDVARIVRDVVHLARRSGRGEGDVPVVYEGPTALEVRADGAQLRQVVWNLVRNAVQASVADTPVTVRTLAEGGDAIVEVSDGGAGIPASMRARIFDAFMTTRSQGIGIGLAVVKQIVDAHQGTIQVTDSPGGGTTFRVILPNNTENPADADYDYHWRLRR